MMDVADFEVQTAAFLSWLAEVGVQINPKMQLVDLRSEGRGRGVVAAADFDEDEIVFSIPRNSVFNVQTGLANASSSNFQDVLDMPSWLALTTLMISEGLRTDSKWAPYFAVLPQQLDSLVFWSETELAELQASTVVKKIGKAKAEEMFSQHIAPLGPGHCDTDMYHRVASIIMAYAFDIPEEKTTSATENNMGGEDEGEEELVSDDEEDEKTLLSMIPLADMLNADAERNNARLSCDNEDLEMRTIKPITKGEEILNDYGQLPRSDLLRRYGYVTEQYAIYDVAEMLTKSILSAFKTDGMLQTQTLESLSNEDLQKRVELAEREGVYEDSYDLVHSGPNGPTISDELLALLYILLVDADNLEAIASSQSSLPSRSKLATELTGQVLQTLFKAREREYATTLEEDETIIRTETTSGRKAMAVQVRLGEKRVLREAIQEATSFSGSNKRMRLSQAASHGQETQNRKGKRQAEEASKPNKKGRFR